MEKRLESALTGHWQARVAEKLRLHASPNGNIAWDQAALLNAMDRFWADAFKTVLGRAERSIVNELVAYLRQIYKADGLPSGSFDANLSFVQSLTEAVKTSPGTLLVAELPASQIEVGGEGGQEAHRVSIAMCWFSSLPRHANSSTSRRPCAAPWRGTGSFGKRNVST